MADLKISQLSAATALAGTEVVPVVQSGSTKKATIDQILAPAAGKGLDFSASSHAAGMTSELFNDYEEGTWTPSVAPGGGTITYTSSGRYTKTGRVVTAEIRVDISLDVGGIGGLTVSNFPYAAATAKSLCGATREDTGAGFGIVGSGLNTTSIYLTKYDGSYPGGTNYGFTLVVSYSV